MAAVTHRDSGLALLDKIFSSQKSDKTPPDEIAGCRPIEKLAEGPMSRVYRCEDRDGNIIVAKVLTEHGNRIAEKLSVRLGKPWEGEKAKPLTHPNVVRTIDCGKDKNGYYILMEYLPGGNFAQHLRDRAPEIMTRRLDVLIGAANGLAYVHEKGIIHRDVCPKNLMFDSEGTVKLIDFGVSIYTHDRLKQTEVRTGRPSYLAPELIRYNHFNAQTDVYAFGVMLYEAFTGQRPFAANSRDELLGLHLRAEVIAPSRIDASLNDAIDRVVLKAMAKNPAERHENMRQLLTDLIRLKQGTA